jgi:hypothetical protein
MILNKNSQKTMTLFFFFSGTLGPIFSELKGGNPNYKHTHQKLVINICGANSAVISTENRLKRIVEAMRFLPYSIGNIGSTTFVRTSDCSTRWDFTTHLKKKVSTNVVHLMLSYGKCVYRCTRFYAEFRTRYVFAHGLSVPARNRCREGEGENDPKIIRRKTTGKHRQAVCTQPDNIGRYLSVILSDTPIKRLF